ncbi:MAG TPA: hypothetical protein VLJ88_07090 [Propionibacteriaceae bacterium]|nr:hypothetical protein [Propionibacteriaceae bacterium]
MSKDRDLDVLLIQCWTETQDAENPPNDQKPQRPPHHAYQRPTGSPQVRGKTLNFARFRVPYSSSA